MVVHETVVKLHGLDLETILHVQQSPYLIPVELYCFLASFSDYKAVITETELYIMLTRSFQSVFVVCPIPLQQIAVSSAELQFTGLF